MLSLVAVLVLADILVEVLAAAVLTGVEVVTTEAALVLVEMYYYH